MINMLCTYASSCSHIELSNWRYHSLRGYTLLDLVRCSRGQLANMRATHAVQVQPFFIAYTCCQRAQLGHLLFPACLKLIDVCWVHAY